MTMNAISEENLVPCLTRCHIRLTAWSNRAGSLITPLVAPHFLQEVNEAFVACRDWAYRATLPVFGERYRLLLRIPGTGTLEDHNRGYEAERQLSEAIKNLQIRWPEVLTEAEERLKGAFSPSLFPNPTRLSELWLVEVVTPSGSEKRSVSTLELLGAFSKFHKSDPAAEKCEILTYLEELHEEKAKLAERRKLPLKVPLFPANY